MHPNTAMHAPQRSIPATPGRPTFKELLHEVQKVVCNGGLVEHAVARVVGVGEAHVDGAVHEDHVCAQGAGVSVSV